MSVEDLFQAFGCHGLPVAWRHGIVTETTATRTAFEGARIRRRLCVVQLAQGRGWTAQRLKS